MGYMSQAKAANSFYNHFCKTETNRGSSRTAHIQQQINCLQKKKFQVILIKNLLFPLSLHIKNLHTFFPPKDQGKFHCMHNKMYIQHTHISDHVIHEHLFGFSKRLRNRCNDSSITSFSRGHAAAFILNSIIAGNEASLCFYESFNDLIPRAALLYS